MPVSAEEPKLGYERTVASRSDNGASVRARRGLTPLGVFFDVLFMVLFSVCGGYLRSHRV
jgi:hypothetical protein